MINRISYLALAMLLAVTACNNPNSTSTANSDSTTTAISTDTIAKKYTLEPVFEDSTYQFTGIAKEDGGQLFITYPRWSDVYRYAVITTQGISGVKPYPTAAMNNWQPGQPGQEKWVCVQSMYIDDAGSYWVIDPAAPMLKQIQGNGAKLVELDKNTSVIVKNYNLGQAISDTSYANDVRVDTKNNFAYITDSKTGGIIVVNLGSGSVREVLKGDKSTGLRP